MLTPKQQHILNRAIFVFGEDKIVQYKDIIAQKINNTLEIEYLPDFSDAQVQDLLNDVIYNPLDTNLAVKYIVPPFSTLDTKNGKWLERRGILDEYIGDSLVGRKGGLAYGDFERRRAKLDAGGIDPLVGRIRADDNGTSKFDSVLCEVLLKWFGFENCSVLDPFAGGSVRGIMAGLLGYKYLGIDLSAEQIAANIERGDNLGLSGITWICDDSQNLEQYVNEPIDLLFSCPPYGDLEKYTDDPKDLSNMDYAQFIDVYSRIIGKAVAQLRPNRFAAFVVADFRDTAGFYRGFVKDTILAFENAGMRLYNEIILLNAIGSASMRASGMFGGNRKVVKVHQNVLVFFKGDPKEIKVKYTSINSKLPLPTKPKETNQLF